ncbi:hypothetical protein E2C01_098108 [Portunus trituberculatus]|uniref:Uncharacterized protein n=1 Tax=Portunus trituberculatus TaxID=210409 RepID=A0A5B7KC11_PORTR|nr:hypothetical protein [Portunus trituberculatus]
MAAGHAAASHSGLCGVNAAEAPHTWRGTLKACTCLPPQSPPPLPPPPPPPRPPSTAGCGICVCDGRGTRATRERQY